MIRSMVIPDAICFKHGNLVHHKSSSEPISYRYVSVTLLIAVKQIEKPVGSNNDHRPETPDIPQLRKEQC